MVTRDGNESTLEAELAGLPVHDARPERVARIRAECLAALGRTRHENETRRQVTRLWRFRFEALAATGLAALFLAAAVERALEILG